MTQGYFLVALGRQYIDECVLLTKTIRKQDDQRPVSLLIHQDDLEYANSKNMFDKFVIFNPNDNLWKECSTGFEKYCLYPRLYFDEYIPYDENIIIDSDVLCQFNANEIWKYMSDRSNPVGMLGRKNDLNWHWGKINQVSEAYGKHVPHVHGGFFYLRKHFFLKEFFTYAREVFYKYDEYKCQRAFRGGRVDEIIFAICHANFAIWPIEFDQYPVMTFNYTSEVQVPSKLQTEGGQNIELTDYIPFVHMFDKMGGYNFESLYKKIMT